MQTQNKETLPLSTWIAILSALSIMACAVVIIKDWVDFLQNVERPLAIAATTKSTEECQKSINTAITYLKGRGLAKTSEHFSADPDSPSIQVWFNNLVEIQEALDKTLANRSEKHEAMLLMLISERLLTQKHGPQQVILPKNVRTYPRELYYESWVYTSFVMFLGGLFWSIKRDRLKEDND